MKRCWLFLLLFVLGSPLHAAFRPNILWITVEDMSPNLGCYGDPFARTPNLDRFARQSVRYTRAFATAPVCSPSRSCLITGVHATTLGTQSLRSTFPIPKSIRAWPAYLREAGYHTSNNVKTDYNTSEEPRLVAEGWNESGATAHWRKRTDKARPFFSVFNLMTTHQSRTGVWPWEEFEREVGRKLSPGERANPAKVPLPPYYPDTPLVRKYLARYYDCIAVMDREVGDLLRQLEDDGLADNTIVFFYSDHGMGMPRGKRVLHDSGLRVPLMIHFPDRWQHLAPARPGGTIDRLVSFVDFPPTVLSLLGMEIPKYMQGTAFLGEANGPERKYVYGARDRVDEVYELSRSVRDDRWLYIRNYLPHLSWAPPERYSDNAEFRREIRQLAAEGKLNAAQMTYAGPRKAVEELYDTAADPHQIHNLAGVPEHESVLNRLRGALQNWMQQSRDVAFLPEAEVWSRLHAGTPYDLARDARAYPRVRLGQAASLVGEDSVEGALQLSRDPEPGVRYWATVALHASSDASDTTRATLTKALTDKSAPVRIEAAAALARKGEAAIALPVLKQELAGDNLDATLQAARALELLGPVARPLQEEMRTALAKAKANLDQSPLNLFIQFAMEEALEEFARGNP